VRTEAVLPIAVCCYALLNGCASSNPLPATLPQTPHEVITVPEWRAYPTPGVPASATTTAVPSPSALAGASATPTAASTTPTPTSTPVPLSPDERHLADLINQERSRAGKQILPLDSILTTVAQERSRDMLVRNYFSHTDPVSQVPLAPSLLRRYGLDIPYGENLFKSAPYQPGLADEAMRLLMSDPAHRDIILSADWTAMGVGIVSGEAVIITEIFGVR
jgi:uncharacterized protein YkwD